MLAAQAHRVVRQGVRGAAQALQQAPRVGLHRRHVALGLLAVQLQHAQVQPGGQGPEGQA